jgi:hypothetical protein
MPITIYGDGYITGLGNVSTSGNVVSNSAVLTNGVTFSDGTTQTAPAIGYGQTWQNVAASRAFGVTYTNSTGQPMQVIVAHSSAVQYTEFYMTIDGLTIMHGRNAMPNTTNGRDTAFVIVPPGSTYSFTGGSLAAWLELR